MDIASGFAKHVMLKYNGAGQLDALRQLQERFGFNILGVGTGGGIDSDDWQSISFASGIVPIVLCNDIERFAAYIGKQDDPKWIEKLRKQYMEELSTSGQIKQFNELVKQALGHGLDILAGKINGIDPDILLRGRDNFIN